MDCLERINGLLKERGWTMYQLAKLSGIPQSTLSNLFVRNNSPTISTLEKICAAFGISLAEFFATGEEVDKERERVIMLYSKLAPETKKSLLTFWKPFNIMIKSLHYV